MRTYSSHRRGPPLVDLILPPVSISILALRLAHWLVRCVARSRQRAQLADLDEHLLADIGVTRAEARREADKPFWM